MLQKSDDSRPHASSLQPSQQGRERTAVYQLILSTFFFGVSFIGQKKASDQGIQPTTYNACRFAVSFLLLLILKPWLQSAVHTETDEAVGTQENKFMALWKWGGLCGVMSFGGSVLQQVGLRTVSAGKTGFITGMYVIFVPIVEWCLPGLGRDLRWQIWAAAFISIYGLYLLSGCGESGSDCYGFGGTDTGELIVFISMFFWVVSIISAEIGTKKVDGVSFTLVEFFICTILSLIVAPIIEPEQWRYPFSSILKSWDMILFVGFTEGVSFLLGTLGQMYVTPSKASLIFSLESVVAAAGGYIVLGETLTLVELFGCALMMAACVLATYSSLEGEDEDHDNSLLSLAPIVHHPDVEMPIYKSTIGAHDDDDTTSSRGAKKMSAAQSSVTVESALLDKRSRNTPVSYDTMTTLR